jgi:hypothetical protein
MLLRKAVGNYEIRRWGWLQYHIVHTKFC